MAFARAWSKVTPADTDLAITLGAAIRNLREDIEERMEIDHEWTDATDGGKHKKVTFLDPLSSKPSAVTDEGYIYTKNVNAKAELFWEDEAGNEFQITELGKLSLALITALPNTIPLQAKESGGTARDIAKLTSGNVLQLGNTTTVTLELLVNSLTTLLARTGAGTFRIITTDDEGTGNNFDADTLDGIEGVDHVRYDSPNFAEVTIKTPLAEGEWSAAHGITSPRWAYFFIQCLIAEDGYEVGDKIPIGETLARGSSSRGLTAWWSAANVGLNWTSDTRFIARDDGAHAIVQDANWAAKALVFK